MSGSDPDAADGFLGRWSRRKRAADRTAPAPPPPAEQHLVEDTEPEQNLPTDPAPPLMTEEEIAALPRIEDLVEGSDIKAFLQAGVPRALKNAALRRVWMLTPAIRDYKNPAVDYAWDWNTPGGVPGDGVAPSLERSAQMLHDLITPRTPPAAEPEPEPEPAMLAADTSAETDPARGEPAAVEDSPSPDPAGDAAARPEGAASENPGAGAPAPGRPRHGGALPS